MVKYTHVECTRNSCEYQPVIDDNKLSWCFSNGMCMCVSSAVHIHIDFYLHWKCIRKIDKSLENNYWNSLIDRRKNPSHDNFNWFLQRRYKYTTTVYIYTNGQHSWLSYHGMVISLSFFSFVSHESIQIENQECLSEYVCMCCDIKIDVRERNREREREESKNEHCLYSRTVDTIRSTHVACQLKSKLKLNGVKRIASSRCHSHRIYKWYIRIHWISIG